MKILVTGGAGFIGSHVCDALLARGDQVVCLDNFNDYYDPKLKENNVKPHLANKKFQLYKTDILNFEELKKIFQDEKPDRIIHLAARAGVYPSLKNPQLYQKVNVEGTLNILELARQFKTKNFVFGSSSSIYGERKKVPFSEADRVDHPVSPYAATKKAGELLCYTYHHLYHLNISCLRFFTVYGPRNRPDMAAFKFTDLIARDKELPIYGDGTSKRDYTYVADIVQGILSALDKEFGFEIFNLGNSQPIELNYLVSLLEKELGKKAHKKYLEKQPGDVELTFADIEKSQRLLGYHPQISIEEGIKKLVEWYKLEFVK